MKTIIYIVYWLTLVSVPCPDSDVYDEFGRYQYTTYAYCTDYLPHYKVFDNSEEAYILYQKAVDAYDIYYPVIDSVIYYPMVDTVLYGLFLSDSITAD